MRNKTMWIAMGILLVAVIGFTGCGKKEIETEPVISEAVEEIEATVPEEVVEPVEEETTPIEDIVPEEEIVETVVEEEPTEGTTLTQEELDQLKANAPTDEAKKNVEIYESITNNGSWTSESGTYTKIVGTPDGSWKKLTDAEAQAIVDTGAMTKEAFLAACELEGTSFCRVIGDTVYLDPYAYREAADNKSSNETTLHDIEWSVSDTFGK